VEIKILVQHGGWNLVVRYDPASGGALVRSDLKAVIRRWGTDSGEHRGLGELARRGPTERIILDWEPGGEINFALSQRIIDCNAEAWREAFKRGEEIDNEVRNEASK
jgi:hypothetical protein